MSMNDIDLDKEDAVDFDETIKKRVFHFKWKGEEYTLVEATAADGVQFRNAAIAGFKFGASGSPEKVTGIATVEPLLVHLCSRDKHNKLVPLKTVESWPNRMLKDLFERAKAMSDLGEDASLDGLIKQRTKLDEQIQKLQTAESERKNSQAPSTTDSD